MANERQLAFASPGIYGLSKSPGHSYVLSRINMMQSLLSKPINQGKGASVLFAPKNSSEPSPDRMKAHSRPPKSEEPPSMLMICLSGIAYGTVGAVCATVVAPIERVYTLMQCQNEMIKAGRLLSPYKGLKDCFLRTVKHEGVLSLWQGNGANMIRVMIKVPFALLWLQIPLMRYMVKKVNESPLWILPSAAIPSLLSEYPLQYARLRLATDVKVPAGLKFSLDSARSLRSDTGTRQFRGVFDLFKTTLKSDGFSGLYRGCSVTCIGFVAGYLASEWFSGTSNQDRSGKKKSMLLDAVGGLIILRALPVAFYPFLTIGRRMTMTSGQARKYNGAFDAFLQIVTTEGVSSLFKGVTGFVMCELALDISRIVVSMCVPAGADWFTKSMNL